jgi:hypothetical protein
LTNLKLHFSDFELTDDVHMVIPFFSRPYEPDIVLFDRERNLYIDIEIDEPYDGYYRYPTHNIRSEDQQKQDNTRDLFFNESGWIVIRFTEKQAHCETGLSISHIRNVLNSIYKNCLVNESHSFEEEQWDENQSIQWQKTYYRENYLGISHFQKQRNLREIAIDTEETEDIEKVIKRTKVFNIDDWTASIAFDEETLKDARDIINILTHYFDWQAEMIYGHHADLFGDDEGSLSEVSAIVIGREMKKIVADNLNLYERLIDILTRQIELKENSAFIRNMVNEDNSNVEEIIGLLKSLLHGFL